MTVFWDKVPFSLVKQADVLEVRTVYMIKDEPQ
jgi:hypothetical protein